MSDPISEIKQKLQKEIDQLSHELNVLLPKEIAVARAHGDLSENAEYKSAKERQSYVNAKIGHLKKRMGDLGMLNLSNIPRDRSGYGSRLTVLDVQRNVKVEYKLVSTEEADAEKGLISTNSTIGPFYSVREESRFKAIPATFIRSLGRLTRSRINGGAILLLIGLLLFVLDFFI